MSQVEATDGGQGSFTRKAKSNGGEKRSEKAMLEPQSSCYVVAKGGRRGRNSKSKNKMPSSNYGGEGLSKKYAHLVKEKKRREMTRDMFSNLHELLPHLPPKADKATIVLEAMNHIKFLEETLQNLQKQKSERIQKMSSISCNKPLSSPAISVAPQQLPMRKTTLAEEKNLATTRMSSPVAKIFSAPSNSCLTSFSPNVVLNVTGVAAQISICSMKKPGIVSGIIEIMEKHMLETTLFHIFSDSEKSTYMIHAHVTETDMFLDESLIEETFMVAADEIFKFLSE